MHSKTNDGAEKRMQEMFQEPKRDYWQVKLYGGKRALVIESFDDKPTAERFALDAIEIGPFSSAVVETLQTNEEFGPTPRFATFDEYTEWSNAKQDKKQTRSAEIKALLKKRSKPQ